MQVFHFYGPGLLFASVSQNILKYSLIISKQDVSMLEVAGTLWSCWQLLSDSVTPSCGVHHQLVHLTSIISQCCISPLQLYFIIENVFKMSSLVVVDCFPSPNSPQVINFGICCLPAWFYFVDREICLLYQPQRN